MEKAGGIFLIVMLIIVWLLVFTQATGLTKIPWAGAGSGGWLAP